MHPMCYGDWLLSVCLLLGEHMKTSIFDMNFTLPPMLEMTEVEKEMPTASVNYCSCNC